MSGIAELIQKSFCHDQIGGVETLRKAVVDRLEAGDGVGELALIAKKASEACGGAQFPGARALPARPVDRLPEVIVGCGRRAVRGLQQKKLAFDARRAAEPASTERSKSMSAVSNFAPSSQQKRPGQSIARFRLFRPSSQRRNRMRAACVGR
jgi:hypothetical protein